MFKVFSICLMAILLATAVYAQGSRPDCVSSASDPDGDGYGYENGTTCLVTANNTGASTQQPRCIDDDGDGWGW